MSYSMIIFIFVLILSILFFYKFRKKELYNTYEYFNENIDPWYNMYTDERERRFSF